MTAKPPAVVLGLGCHSVIGLEIARSLGRFGVQVTALSSGICCPARYSRFCQIRKCPSPRYAPEGLLEFLISFAKRHGNPLVLFSGGEEESLFVSQHWGELQGLYRCPLPPPELTPRIIDKRALYEAIGNSGSVIPESHFPGNWEEVDAIQDRIGYPAFIKPTHSHRWFERGKSKGWLVNNERELRAALSIAFARQLAVCVQSVVPGPSSNLFTVQCYINGEGRLLAYLQYRKLRDRPAGFGLSTYVETVDDPNLANQANSLLQQLGYRGLAALEFKRDDRDGTFKLLEINPRMNLPCGLFRVAGVDFARLAYRDLAGDNPAPQFAYRTGVRWLYCGLDFQESWRQIRAQELSVGHFLTSLARTRTEAVFSWDDPLPAVQYYGVAIARRAMTLLAGAARIGIKAPVTSTPLQSQLCAKPSDECATPS